jgi:hypothetical protein
VSDADSELTLQLLASTYVPDEHRIRDTVHIPGQRVLTFAHILKYREFPLADILKDLLSWENGGWAARWRWSFPST